MTGSKFVPVRVVAAAIVALCAMRASAQATVQSVAQIGQAAPGGSAFASFNGISVNNQGQVGFNAGLSSGLSGHYRGTPAARALIAREGQTAPDGNGVLDPLFAGSSINAAGDIAFVADLTGTTGGANDNRAVYRGNGGPLTTIARENQNAPDGNGQFSTFLGPLLNDAGQVAFHGTLRNSAAGNADNTGLFIGLGGAVSTLVREGQDIPLGTGKFGGFSPGALNDAGQLAFHSNLSGVPLNEGDRGIFRTAAAGVTQIARRGELAPDGNGRFEFISFTAPTINSSGQVLFTTDLAGTANGAADNSGLFIGSGGPVSQVARERQDAPDGNGRIFSILGAELASSGRATFDALLANTAGGTTDDRAIYQGTGGTLTTIVREGQQAPNGNGTFSGIIDFDASASGQVAFVGVLTGTAGGATNGTALFFYDEAAGGLVEILRRGTPLFGSTVTDVTLGDLNALNDVGQFAFQYNLANGQSGIALATVPEPASLAAVALPIALLARRRRLA